VTLRSKAYTKFVEALASKNLQPGQFVTQKQLVELLLGLGKLGVEAGDLLFHRLHFFDRGGALGFVFFAADRLRGGVAACLELIGPPEQPAAPAIEPQGLLSECRGAVIKQTLAIDLEHLFRPFAEIFYVEHGEAFFSAQRRGVKGRTRADAVGTQFHIDNPTMLAALA